MGRKKEVPKGIAEFYDRHAKVETLLAATKEVHSRAYLAGMEAFKNKEGQPDYERLEDTAVQDQMLEKMVETYVTSALERLGGKGISRPATGGLEEDMFLQKYVGVTRGELRKLLRKGKKRYTLEQHEKIRDELVEKQEKELKPLRHSHLEKKDISDILGHTKVNDYVNAADLEVEQAVPLLDMYKEHGEVTLAGLKALADKWGTDYHLTAKGKKGIKDLKDAYKKAA